MPTRSIARVMLSPAMERISVTISSLVLLSRITTWCAPRLLAFEDILADVTVIVFRLLRAASWIANCPVTALPPQIRMYSACVVDGAGGMVPVGRGT